MIRAIPRLANRCVVLALAATAAPTALAAVFAGVDVPPPPPSVSASDTHFGTTVTDPYRALENVSDPAVQAWMKSEAEATNAILSRIPGRAPLLARIREIENAAPGVATNVVRTQAGRIFFLRRDPGDNQFKLVRRDSPRGADTIIVDPERLTRETGKPHAIMDFSPSRDGRKLAYSLQVGGGEIGTLHVIDVETGKPLAPPLDRIRYANVSWLTDGSAFFYSRLKEGFETLPVAERFSDRTTHFRSLAGSGADRAVFSASRNPALALPTYASGHLQQIPGTRIVLATVFLGTERDRLVYVGDLDAVARGDAQWRQVATQADKVTEATATRRWIYLRTANDAPRFRVVRVPLADPDLARAQVVVDGGESVVTSIAAARDALYVTQRDGVTLSLWRVSHDPRPRTRSVALPFSGSVKIDDADPLKDGAVLELGGWTRMAGTYAYDPAANRVSPWPLVKPGSLDATDRIESREVRVKSHDGTEVPVSILLRKDAKQDGSNPTILYGYGAYGITEDPFFNPRIYAWIERGGIFAIAHVRGGGAFGDAWHSAGRKATKPNTWKDAIAAAQWLVANDYTSSARIGIYGGSAGGIFVGRAITERPGLFAAAVPTVGVLDTVRFEASANGAANIPEFGTVRNEDDFRALLAMSSYHNVRDGTAYPGVMLVHGVNDIRVDVWQSLKFAARLAAATTSGRPVLLRLEYDAGHGQGSTREQLQARTADIWSFMLWQFGAPAFQPKAD